MKIIYRYLFLGLITSMITGCFAAPQVAQQETAKPEEVKTPAPQPASEPEPVPMKTPETPKQEVPVKTTPAPVKKAQPAVTKEPVKKEAEPVKQEDVTEKKESAIEVKPQPVAEEKTEIIAEFEGVIITKENYLQTKMEIEKVVDQLNRITSAKDYTQWIEFLSEDYKNEYSKQTTLNKVSEALPVKGIKLKSLKDYFLYVFVPSRQNIRVDDIRYVSATHVNVIMKQGNVALLIYGIENASGDWKLVPPKR